MIRTVNSSALFVLSLMVSLLMVNGGHVKGQSMSESVSGKWILESAAEELNGGTMEFKDGMQYSFYKRYTDGTGAEVKGSYLLEEGESSHRLRLCLGDCHAAGSEWTSTFCLIRLGAGGKLEIYMSQDGNYPGKFPEDNKATGMYVFARE